MNDAEAWNCEEKFVNLWGESDEMVIGGDRRDRETRRARGAKRDRRTRRARRARRTRRAIGAIKNGGAVLSLKRCLTKKRVLWSTIPRVWC